MKVYINGASREVARARNVTELVEELGLPPKALLVEHNGLALRPGEWDERSLNEGDRLELVRIVAGG